MKLVECVPNFSEGRRPEVVAAIRDAIAAVEGVLLLDVSSDPSHNRSVITFVAPLERAVQAALPGLREARERIDLHAHQGDTRGWARRRRSLRPAQGPTMEECFALAPNLGPPSGRTRNPLFFTRRGNGGAQNLPNKGRNSGVSKK